MLKLVQIAKRKIRLRIKGIKNKYKIIRNLAYTTRLKFGLVLYLKKRVKRNIKRFRESNNKICYILRNLLETRFIYLLISILIMLKTIFFYNQISLNSEEFNHIYELSFMFILLSLSPILLVKRNKNRFYISIFLDILISLILFADSVYWRFAVNMLSISQVFYIKYAEEIISSISYYLTFEQIYFFIDILILFALWIIARFPFKKKKTKIVEYKGKRKLVLVCIYVLLLTKFISKPISQSFDDMKELPYLKFMQVGVGSIFGYHYLDIYNSFNMKETTKYKTYPQIQEAYDLTNNASIKIYDEFSGISKGRNVIILQLESIQNFVIGRSINGKEITPNLNEFLRENIEITNMMSQSYSTTADSEYSVMTSMYPLENGQVFSMYNTNINNDIYSLYKDNGYNTYYMHGNTKEFWNRFNVYERLKIDEKSYIHDFEDVSETINDYLSDELLYKQAAEKLSLYETPNITSIVAASSHTPYDLRGIIDKGSKVNIDIGEYADTQFGYYLEAVNYADYAFGIFINELKEKGLYDDTVMIVFGDHYGLSIDNEEMKSFIKEVNSNYNDITRKINYVNVVCGMKIPGIKSMKIDVPVSKIDIKPTLLQVSGIEDNFSLGNTIFSSKDYAYINNGIIITENYYYDEDWYYISTGEKVNFEYLEEEEVSKLEVLVENMKLQLDISSSIVINDLLRNN